MAIVGGIEQLSLDVELKCSSDGSQTRTTLLFSPPPETVADIKRRIEAELSIPRCVQSAGLPDGQILLDSQRVAGLYLRSGDTLEVTYFAEADVERLSKDINRVLRPTLELLSANSSLKNAKLLQKRRDSDALLATCQSSLHGIAYESLLPWSRARTEANRRYLIHEGAMDLLLQLYALLLPLPWDWRGHTLQNLEICCLSVLWNFSETAYARQLVVDKGGFEMMLKSLMHYSVDEFLKKYTMHDIFDAASGCLSNYCELECCQLPMAQNASAVARLLQFALHGPSVNIFTKMFIANLFFRLSHCQQAHVYLIETTTMEQLIRFSDIQNIAIRYILGLTYARLVLFSQENIQQHFLQQMNDCMKSFLLQTKPSVVSRLEERYQYNWITMRPFLDAAYTCGVEATKLSDARLEKSQSSGTFTETESREQTEDKEALSVDTKSAVSSLSLAYVLFALMVELLRPSNRKLVIEQGLLDYVVMLHWGMDSTWHSQCQWTQEEIRKTKKLPVPRLSSIAKGKLARTNKEYSGQLFTA